MRRAVPAPMLTLLSTGRLVGPALPGIPSVSQS
jgi:hypothetical protein